MKLLAVVLFFILHFLSNLQAGPLLGLSKSFWNFGRVEKSSNSVDEVLIIKNLGDQTLKVFLKVSCDCIKLDWNKVEILPGKEKALNIRFDISQQEGKISDFIFIESNDPEVPVINWPINGEIIVLEKREDKYFPEKHYTRNPGKEIDLQMFFYPGCKYCEEIIKKIIPVISEKHSIKINLHKYDISIAENYRILLTMEERLKIKIYKMPCIIVNRTVLEGNKNIRENLEKVIINNSGITGLTSGDVKEKVETEIPRIISKLKILPVLAGGLIDGINPCAFTAIIFLIIYLSTVSNKNTQEIFLTGVFFISGVYIFYFLTGLGLIRLFEHLQKVKFISLSIYFLAGFLSFIFAVLNFVDFFSMTKDQKSRIILKLPNSLRSRVFEIIQKYANVKFLVFGGFFIGFLISMFEFFCTGQIYLPTIIYMMKIGYTGKALLYLILYCLMFILPLFVVFLLVLFGIKSEKIEKFVKNNFKTVKLVTGIFFLILSFIIFGYIFNII